MARYSLEGANVTHGLASTYRNYGCRCASCTQDHRGRHARETTARAERLARGEANPTHGTHSTYTDYKQRRKAANR